MDEDAHLLQRTADGDDAAFAILYRRHRDVVVAYLRRRVAEPEVAFDLTAETFAQVILSAGTYRGDGPVIGWVLGIARNQLADAVRRGQVEDRARRRLALEPTFLDDDDLERIEERAAAADDRLEDALAALNPPIRAALLARVVDEDAYDEIAARLGCSEQVVRQRVHRGLARLRAALESGR